MALQEETPASPRRKISGWVRLGISATLLTVLLTYVDLAESWRILRESNLEFVVLIFVLYLALRFHSAYRWFVLLHGKNPAISFGKVIRFTFISLFMGSFMPGGVELVRMYLMSKTTADFTLTISSMLVERVFSLLTLFLLVLLGLFFAPLALPPMLGRFAWLGLLLLALGSLTAMNSTFRSVIDRQLQSGWLTPLRTRLGKIYTHLDSYKLQPYLLGWSILLAFNQQFLRIAITVIGAWALGVKLPLLTFVVLVPIIFFVSVLPISVSGLGVREVAFVSLLSLVGVSAERAFTLSLLLYGIGLLTTLPGAYLYAKASPERK